MTKTGQKNMQGNIKIPRCIAYMLAVFVALAVSMPTPAFALGSSFQGLLASWLPCWFCDIFDGVYVSCGHYAFTVYEATKDDVLGLLTVALLFWLLVQMMKGVGSVAAIDPIEFWSKAGQRLFAGIIAAAFLKAGAIEIYGYLLSPVIEGATEFGSALLGSCDASVTEDLLPIPVNNAFSEESRRALFCMLHTMNEAIAEGMGLGIILIIESLSVGLLDPIPDVGMLFSGVVLVLVYFAILVIMPLYLIDAIVRLGIVGGLMPLFIVAWVFPSTKFFSGKGWGMLVQSALTLVS
ncbi:MAG: hypothetical protein KAJ75_05960, partial [Alphaproteobacteria bacterium]|nr:hypothetical protein [Alphaproteobacteria bacterium]